MAPVSDEAWVTLATSDEYALGALVLGSALKNVGTTRKRVVMLTSGVSEQARQQLEAVFDELEEVDAIDSRDQGHLEMLGRPELGITLTKIKCWKLTRFNKAVFLDADTLVLKNCDELFEREELSAAADAGWPDCFNSGVFVFKPSNETYERIHEFALSQGSFDGGDQGLLNDFFSDWRTRDISKHLSFLYNMCATATYTYLPAYRRFGHDARIIHFIGAVKPWHVVLDSRGLPLANQASFDAHSIEHLRMWWQAYHSCQSQHQIELGATKAVAGDVYAGGAFVTGEAANTARANWERGDPDYTGRSSFDNILKKLDETMSTSDECEELGVRASVSLSDLRLEDDQSGPVHYESHPNLHWPEHHQAEQSRQEDNQSAWESGRPDFMGVNAFDNIRAKLDAALQQTHQPYEHQHFMPQEHHDSHQQEQHHQQQEQHHQQQEQQQEQHEQHHQQQEQQQEQHHQQQEQHHQQQEQHHQQGQQHQHQEHQEHQEIHQQEQPQQDQQQEQDAQHRLVAPPVVDALDEKDSQQHANVEDVGAEAEVIEPVFDPKTAPLPTDEQQEWERGQPDYSGKAAFDFILRRIELNIGEKIEHPKKPIKPKDLPKALKLRRKFDMVYYEENENNVLTSNNSNGLTSNDSSGPTSNGAASETNGVETNGLTSDGTSAATTPREGQAWLNRSVKVGSPCPACGQVVAQQLRRNSRRLFSL